MKENVLLSLSRQFTKEMIFFCKELKCIKVEADIVNQLLRASTSIEANIYEANYAQSKNDFVSKLQIALKECFETEYWLQTILDVNYISEANFKLYRNKAGAIRKILISSINTLNENK
jgi:four helix bundle protein